MTSDRVILAPLVTEKSAAGGEKANRVVFKVSPEASKDRIRLAVEDLFKVAVVKVRTGNFLGKRRRRGRTSGRQRDWKKAYVTLKQGDRIEFFEGV